MKFQPQSARLTTSQKVGYAPEKSEVENILTTNIEAMAVQVETRPA